MVIQKDEAVQRERVERKRKRDVVIQKMSKRILDGDYNNISISRFGITSRQIGAVVDMIVELEDRLEAMNRRIKVLEGIKNK